MVNRSEWAAPTSISPKKDTTVRLIPDFRELNEGSRGNLILSQNTMVNKQRKNQACWKESSSNATHLLHPRIETTEKIPRDGQLLQLQVDRRKQVLTPLTQATSERKSHMWTMERILSNEVLLTYPDFIQPFDIHTNACNHAAWFHYITNGRPIASYTCKHKSSTNSIHHNTHREREISLPLWKHQRISETSSLVNRWPFILTRRTCITTTSTSIV